MIAAVMERGMVALPHLVCVNAIIYTSDYEGKSQFWALEQNNYIIWCLLFIISSLFVLVMLGFVTLIVLAAVSIALIDVLKVYPNILKITKHSLLYSHWVLFLN